MGYCCLKAASGWQDKFEEKWQAHVVPKLREELAAQHREELDTLRSLRAAAVAARGERLAAQSEAVGSALGRLDQRLREAKSLAAQQCKPLSLPEKVIHNSLFIPKLFKYSEAFENCPSPGSSQSTCHPAEYAVSSSKLTRHVPCEPSTALRLLSRKLTKHSMNPYSRRVSTTSRALVMLNES